MNRDPYTSELIKFIGQEVRVTDNINNIYDGVCVAIGFQHLNVVIMNDKEKIAIKNISSISRKRTFGGEKDAGRK